MKGMIVMLSELFEQSINIIQSLLCTAFLFVMLKLKKNIVHKAVSYLLCSALLYFFINVSNLITAFEGIAIFAYALLLFVFYLFSSLDVKTCSSIENSFVQTNIFLKRKSFILFHYLCIWRFNLGTF